MQQRCSDIQSTLSRHKRTMWFDAENHIVIIFIQIIHKSHFITSKKGHKEGTNQLHRQNSHTIEETQNNHNDSWNNQGTTNWLKEMKINKSRKALWEHIMKPQLNSLDLDFCLEPTDCTHEYPLPEYVTFFHHQHQRIFISDICENRHFSTFSIYGLHWVPFAFTFFFLWHFQTTNRGNPKTVQLQRTRSASVRLVSTVAMTSVSTASQWPSVLWVKECGFQVGKINNPKL